MIEPQTAIDTDRQTPPHLYKGWRNGFDYLIRCGDCVLYKCLRKLQTLRHAPYNVFHNTIFFTIRFQIFFHSKASCYFAEYRYLCKFIVALKIRIVRILD